MLRLLAAREQCGHSVSYASLACTFCIEPKHGGRAGKGVETGVTDRAETNALDSKGPLHIGA